jgi:hypothetical protein
VKIFEEFLGLMSPMSNYTKIRTHIHKYTSPPCIPYLGIYLSDLTFIEDGNPDRLPDTNLINFDRRRRIGVTIEEIQQWQQTDYPFKEVPIIKGYLLAQGEYVDENKCYKLSLEREPRGADSVTKKTPGLSLGTRIRSNTKKSELIRRNLVSLQPSVLKVVKSPVKEKPKEEVTMQDLLDCLLEGNVAAVEGYFEIIEKPEEEKQKMRDELANMFESKMISRGAQRLDLEEGPEPEIEEIPYEKLVEYLKVGDELSLSLYLDEKDVYQSARIREMVNKLLEEQKKS